MIICESCRCPLNPNSAIVVDFDSGEQFLVCANCAPEGRKGGSILESLNRIRYWSTRPLATT